MTIIRFLANFSIFGQNFDLWQTLQFLVKISIFDKNLDSLPNFPCLVKIKILCQIFAFLTKNSFHTTADFRAIQ